MFDARGKAEPHAFASTPRVRFVRDPEAQSWPFRSSIGRINLDDHIH